MASRLDKLADLMLRILACDPDVSSVTAGSPPPNRPLEPASRTSKTSSEPTRKPAA